MPDVSRRFAAAVLAAGPLLAGALLAGSLLAGSLLAACTAGSDRQASRTPSTIGSTVGQVLLATSAGVEAVSLPSGVLRYQVPGGVATADGTTVVATSGDQLVIRDARDGSVRRTIPVPVGLVVSALSGDGKTAALTAPSSASVGSAGYLPAGRAKTTIVVVSLGSGVVTSHELDGNLLPEAFSVDGGFLFVVSYLPAQAPDRYLISSLDLTTGAVDGVFGREKEPPEEMQGIGRTHTLAPDREALYTLYLRPPTSAGASESDHAEVHTLNLYGGWAHCVDLPDDFGNGDLSTASIGVSPGGGRLYVVDGVVNRIAEIETNGLTVTRTASISPSTKAGPTTVAVSARGRIFVGEGTGVVVVGNETLEPLGRWNTDSPVTALAATPSGGVVATTATQVYVFDADGNAHTSPRPAGGEVVAINQVTYR